MARADELADAAERLLAWARTNHALAEESSVPPLDANVRTDVFPALAPGDAEFEATKRPEARKLASARL